MTENLLGKFVYLGQDTWQIVAVWKTTSDNLKFLLHHPHTGELKEVYAYGVRLVGGQQ